MRMFRKVVGLGMVLFLSAMANLAMAAKPTVTIGYVDGWADSVATTFTAAEVIRQQLGYEVKLMPVAAGIMWQGVARGKLDAMLSAWLPGTHGSYYEKMKNDVADLNVNTPDAKIGLIVPEYVKASSIADLAAQKSDFGGRIVGIDAGAGVMIKTEKAIKAYDLDYKLVASSGSGMIAELIRAERDQKPVAVTGWIPHWMFAKWKLKFLDDPKGVYGGSEQVRTMANPGLEKKAKPVWDFLKKFSWQPGEVNEVMLAIEEGKKPEQAAKDWLKAHPDRVKSWL
ncbi:MULTISPECIES: glycine betaine ABC transporter substrate-binding protein [Pseudomonas]|nr:MULTISPECIES: glycine betaine ABC transporter substrate-binding protein [Pseudomonas]MBW5416186.1 glycine/betaine ABC transporter substrate-binding protein [Pseudomonas sp. MAG002Y]